MYVSDYLNLAVRGELKPLTLSNIGNLDYSEDKLSDDQQVNRKSLITFLNQANLEIHRKFSLIQKEFIINIDCVNREIDLPVDFLSATFAQLPNGMEVPINNDRRTFLEGTPSRPGSKSVLLENSPVANQTPLVTVDNWVSILFTSPFKAIIKGEDYNKQTLVSLIYVAAPPKVEKLTDFIDLREVFTEPLINYMAYKAYTSIKGDLQATNNTFYLRYIESCKNIRIEGSVDPDNLDTNIKLYEQGFV
jgi:hypothetical protein